MRSAILASAIAFAAATCPKVTTQPNFNLTAYIDHPWYIQEMMAISYEPTERNFCTRAEYSLKDATTVDVHNSDRLANVTGSQREAHLCAYVKDPSDTARLAVAPCFLPRSFAGPYWVIAAGLYGQNATAADAANDRYDWAIISGGQPTKETPTGCRTGSGSYNSGFWLFAADPIPPAGTVDAMRSIASAQGFDLTVLNPVEQKGCSYPAAE